DKLSRFGVVQSNLCLFGCGHCETVDHLVFDCAFTKAIWCKVLKLNNYLPPVSWNWENAAEWAVEHTVGKHFRFWMRRAGLAVTVYHCWREINNRIFRLSAATLERILSRIMTDVSEKAALCLDISNTPVKRSIVDNWAIDESIFRNLVLEQVPGHHIPGHGHENFVTPQIFQRRQGVG
ncbi:zf-RVT domain-containing protein, partial [Cephalotus follicularis]